ncbi:hypothetical protein KY290_007792 [Solanum tuberosum]|uniref:Uncharacterized protein n=1 Tax=Solanum tuberosum TaxID=4113 RepID=A0ABQ7W6K2_SOLTU|nr:hypothetical protein KY290_007792 [Solanum tuberosum]
MGKSGSGKKKITGNSCNQEYERQLQQSTIPTDAKSPVIYATQALPQTNPPLSWIELGLRDQAVFFTMDLNGQEVMIILQNPNFLSQLISKGMKLAMDNYLNHLWINNIMNPLASAVAPMLLISAYGPGPRQSMNTRPAVKVSYSCKSCPGQEVGEAAEYFTNQK